MPPAKKFTTEIKKTSVSCLILASNSSSKTVFPSCLRKYENGTVLDHQTRFLTNQIGKVDFTLVAGVHLKKLITNYNHRFVFNQFFNDTGEEEQIKLGLINLYSKDGVLIVKDDIIFKSVSFNFSESFVVVQQESTKNRLGFYAEDGILRRVGFEFEGELFNVCYLQGKELAISKEIALEQDLSRRLMFEHIYDIIDRGGKINIITGDLERYDNAT